MIRGDAALGVLTGLLVLAAGRGTADAAERVWLGDTLGDEVDRVERDRYGLFPEIRNFHSARILREEDRYELEYVVERGTEHITKRRPLPAHTVELTLLHFENVDRFERTKLEAPVDPEAESRVLRRLALRQSLERDYDLTLRVLEELERTYPDRYAEMDGPRLKAIAEQLADSPYVLFRDDPLRSGDGRNDLLIFSGYYGLWLAIAIPVAAEVRQPEPYWASLIGVPTISVYTAHILTDGVPVTEAQASMIRLGAQLGTWQGLGWSSMSDDPGHDTEDTIRAGLITGLAGLTVGGLLADPEMTEGHAAWAEAGAPWGAWFGALVELARDRNEEDAGLRAALVGSNALTVAGLLWGKDSRVTEGQIRMMNMGGVIGAIAGVGVLGLAGGSDNPAGNALVLGMSSAAGGLIALNASRPDETRGLATWIGPRESAGEVVPAVGLATQF